MEVLGSCGQKSVTNASITSLKQQLLELTGPNLTEYEEKVIFGNSSQNVSLLQEGRFFSSMWTIGTKAVDFGAHAAGGGNVRSWTVKQVTDPWNYVGFMPGGGAARHIKRGATTAGYVNDAIGLRGNIASLNSLWGSSGRRSSRWQPRPSNRNCETETGGRCGTSGRYAVCKAGSYCSRWGWCGTTSGHKPGHYLYSNNYGGKCGVSTPKKISTPLPSNKCETQTGHRCGYKHSRGVCGRGRWCTWAGWCVSYYTAGNSGWSNNRGGVCR